MKSSAKGSSFERKLCVQLSEWWTQNDEENRSDIFWRTSGSGARAKVRGRKGKKTQNQHGDIAATDPIGQPFIDIFTIEIKRGYNRATFMDLIDKPKRGKVQKYEEWLAQAKESAKYAKSLHWAIIVKRDRREALFITSFQAFENFLRYGSGRELTQTRIMKFSKDNFTELVVFPFQDFLRYVSPKVILDIHENRNVEKE